MTSKEFREWVGRIHATQADEFDCQQVQSLLPAYVDAQLEGYSLSAAAPIEAHLRQCPDCTEVYEGLYFVAAQEAEGALTPSTMPEGELTLIAGD